MDSQQRLEEIFAHFPGIGPRQAKRFVYYLLNKPQSSIKEFIQLIEEVKKSTAECELCHRFFTQHAKPSTGNHKADTHQGKIDANLCPTCADANRDHSTLMIVARDSDFESIEKSGAYRGLYFILGGTVPILDKEPEKRIRLKSLLERISSTNVAQNSGATSPFKEIILSLNTTSDGEHTADIVRQAIVSLKSGSKAVIDGKIGSLQSTVVSILGRGLSTGAELEYVDADTIKSALKNRS
jgi:recombination protein RecR